MTKLFIQPSLGYSDESIEIAFTPRITSVNFSNSDVNITKGNLSPAEFNDFDHTTSYVFFEPGITLRGGLEYVKGHMQVAYSYKLNEEPLNHKSLILNFGIHVNVFEAISAISGN